MADVVQPDPPDIADVRAPRVGLRVVAAKKRGEWIIRAMGSSWCSFDMLRANVERVVGVLDDAVTWTQHDYEGWPGYVIYGKGDLAAHATNSWPMGVFKFDFIPSKSWKPEYPESSDNHGPPKLICKLDENARRVRS